MQHRIGLDYSEILKGRKNKRQLPLIGKLKISANISTIQKQIQDLLATRGEGVLNSFATYDPASSEHNYHLKNTRGESFIQNYDDFYTKYSMIGFHELSEEARDFVSHLDYQLEDLTPSMRMKGMKNTGYDKYHPYYDERNYTKKTQFYGGAIAELLEQFKAPACRSALVCLRPKQFISPHFDVGPEYIARTMLPVFTNPDAVVGLRTQGGYYEYHLPADGGLYFINSGVEHYAINGGDEARYQVRICLNGQQDLEDISEVTPVRFISDQEFINHPCAPKHLQKEHLSAGETSI